MSRDPLIVSGGHAIMFGAAIVLDVRKVSIGEEDPVSKEEAMKVRVTVKKNHCVVGRNPYLRTEYYGIFGQGTERYLEALQNAIEQGVLAKSGAFIKDPDDNGNPKVLEDGTKLQWQGSAKFREYCKANPEYFESLLSRMSGEVTQLTSDEMEAVESEMNSIEDAAKEVIDSGDVIAEAKSSRRKK